MPALEHGIKNTVLGKFLERFPRGGKLLVVTHNHPDPDSISSAAALQELARALRGARTTIAYGGVIGRAENAHMVRYLGLKLRPIDKVDLSSYDRIAMVDTQPRTGNNALPARITPDLIIDHHPQIKTSGRSPYVDIRTGYGALASIMTEYLFSSGVGIGVNLATALLYGIKSETQDLGREARAVDVECYLKLFPRANKRIISKIVNARVPRSYFQSLKNAIAHSKVAGNAVITRLHDIPNPDIVPEFADLMLRLEGAAWAYCSGYYRGAVHLSIRTTNVRRNAGKLMQQLVKGRGTGGGHRLMAGGKVDVPGISPWHLARLQERMEEDFLALIHKDHHPRSPLTAAAAIRI